MDPRMNKSVTPPNLPFPNPSGNVTGNTQYVYNFIHPHPAAAFFSQPPFLQNMTMISPQQFPQANFSGGNENGDLAEKSQPTVLPKKKFTSAEDDALISAFIKVSTDAAAPAAAGAANQSHRKEALWGKVKAVYDEAREANAAEIRERSTGMLNNRFRRISSGVLKFVSCYDEASRHRGLMNEEEVLKYARDLFGGYFHFENCWNIIVGGTDAPAAVVVWAMTALMKHPTIMKKVKSEVRQLGNKDFIFEDDVQNFPYLRAVVKEAFRLYPPAPLLVPRETVSECTVNGYEIEADTTVHINAWAIGRDPEFWENPEEFCPERFLESDVDIRGRDPAVIPFGVGRRGCPGIGMGLAATELALANLVHAFDWELPPGVKEEDVDFDVIPGMTMHKKNPLCAVAKLAAVHGT